MSRIRVLGVGSPAGDDRVGWLVVECLREAPSLAAALDAGDLEMRALDRPGADLVRHLAGAEHVLIVDAVTGAGEPGLLHEIDAADLGRDARPLSGHALGVAGAVSLAEALGDAPGSLRLLAVQAGRVGPLDEPGEAVLAAVPAVAERVLALLEELLRG